MNEMYEIKIVCENDIITTQIGFKPQVGDIVADDNDKKIQIEKIEKIVTISTNEGAITLYTAIGTYQDKKLVGVTQVQFIQGDSYADMNNNLNKFLYDNRHCYEIMNITHATAYVAVTYRVRKQCDIIASMDKECFLNK